MGRSFISNLCAIALLTSMNDRSLISVDFNATQLLPTQIVPRSVSLEDGFDHTVESLLGALSLGGTVLVVAVNQPELDMNV